MALVLCFFFLFVFPNRNNAQCQPPDPGYLPSLLRYPPPKFKQMFKPLWGFRNQRLDVDETLTLWLDQNSGSGIKSKFSYSAGCFAAKIKLQSGYTAGINTAFYLSSTTNYSKKHDEVDFEFLGNVNGQPYVLQTNVLTRQKTAVNGYVIGREQQFHLWFDPTRDFHEYAIIWNQGEITFFVDGIPIRSYPNKTGQPFVSKTLWAFASIWDASSWATNNGLYKADYHFAPFTAEYSEVSIRGCHNPNPAACSIYSASPTGRFGLSKQQMKAMGWVRRNYMIYDYCTDKSRNTPNSAECTKRR